MSVMLCKDRASFASLSACVLPRIPLWPGTHKNRTCEPLLYNAWCKLRISMSKDDDGYFLHNDCATERESVQIIDRCQCFSRTSWRAFRTACDSACIIFQACLNNVFLTAAINCVGGSIIHLRTISEKKVMIGKLSV